MTSAIIPPASPQEGLSEQTIPVEALVPAPWNPRIIDPEAQAFRDLVHSIGQHGVLAPVLVRPQGSGRFQLVAGERRWRAAQAAGLDAVPALVRPLTDEKAVWATFSENFFREDLTPLEQARGVRTLLERCGGDLARVADRVGKSLSWVARRAQLVELSAAWQRALVTAPEVPDFTAWRVGHLELVARLPVEEQDRLLEHLTTGAQGAHLTQADLATVIRDRQRVLSTAPWPLDRADLPGGACTVCPKRTGCQQVLFEDLAGEDRCLDPVCFKGKGEAWTRHEWDRLDSVQRKTPLHLVHHGPVPAALKAAAAGRTCASWEAQPAKKTDAGAVPALVWDGRELEAKLKWFLLPAAAVGRAPGAGTLDLGEGDEGGAAPAAAAEPVDRLSQLRSRRWRWVCAEVAGLLRSGELALALDTSVDELLAAALIVGLDAPWDSRRPSRVQALLVAAGQADEASAETSDLAREALVHPLAKRLGALARAQPWDEREARALLSVVDLDIEDWWHRACAAKPAPKALRAEDDQALPELPAAVAGEDEPAEALDEGGEDAGGFLKPGWSPAEEEGYAAALAGTVSVPGPDEAPSAAEPPAEAEDLGEAEERSVPVAQPAEEAWRETAWILPGTRRLVAVTEDEQRGWPGEVLRWLGADDGEVDDPAKAYRVEVAPLILCAHHQGVATYDLRMEAPPAAVVEQVRAEWPSYWDGEAAPVAGPVGEEDFPADPQVLLEMVRTVGKATVRVTVYCDSWDGPRFRAAPDFHTGSSGANGQVRGDTVIGVLPDGRVLGLVLRGTQPPSVLAGRMLRCLQASGEELPVATEGPLLMVEWADRALCCSPIVLRRDPRPRLSLPAGAAPAPAASGDPEDLERLCSWLLTQPNPRTVAAAARGAGLKRERVAALAADSDRLALSTSPDGKAMVGLAGTEVARG